MTPCGSCLNILFFQNQKMRCGQSTETKYPSKGSKNESATQEKPSKTPEKYEDEPAEPETLIPTLEGPTSQTEQLVQHVFNCLVGGYRESGHHPINFFRFVLDPAREFRCERRESVPRVLPDKGGSRATCKYCKKVMMRIPDRMKSHMSQCP